MGDALSPGRPAPVDRRRSRRDVGPATLVVGPPDAWPLEAAEVEPGHPPGLLLGAERIVGAGPVVAGALPALRPYGERQARVPLHPSQLSNNKITRPSIDERMNLYIIYMCMVYQRRNNKETD